MKPELLEKNKVKLPKKYWFTLIFMWVVAISVSILLIGNSYTGGQYIDFIEAFWLFMFFLILFYFFQKFLKKINLIKIYTIVFYFSLFLFIFTTYTHVPNIPLPYGEGINAYKYMISTGNLIFGYYLFLFIFLTLNTTYLIFKKKLQNLQTQIPFFTHFAISFYLMIITYLPVITAYIIKYFDFFKSLE